MDTMSTGIYSETGTYDAEKGILSTRGEYRDPLTGHLTTTMGTMDMSASDRHVYEGHMIGPDGKKYKTFEGVSIRRK